MKAIRKAIAALKKRLEARKDALGKARRRYKKFHALADREEARAHKAQAKGRTARAERFERRATARKVKAVYWRGVVKREVAKTYNLTMRIGEREADLKKWEKEHGVFMEGHNKVQGGTPRQRLHYAIHRAHLNYRKHDQPGYYSMEGAERKYAHGLYHYPYGHIWDCSTFADAMYFVCGLASPSGPGAYRTGGFTGTELAHGRQIQQSEVKTGDLVIYLRFPGDTEGHHVEVVDDPSKETTMGHGDSAINPGIFNLFGDGLYEFRSYL